jgi:hypothetical protein
MFEPVCLKLYLLARIARQNLKVGPEITGQRFGVIFQFFKITSEEKLDQDIGEQNWQLVNAESL